MTTGAQTSQSRQSFAGKVSLVPPRLHAPAAEQAYCLWVKRLISFYNIRPPAQMAESEFDSFLTHLTLKKSIRASTHHQALSAFLFLDCCAIGRESALSLNRDPLYRDHGSCFPLSCNRHQPFQLKNRLLLLNGARLIIRL